MPDQQVINHIKLIMNELKTLPKEKRKSAALIKVKEIFGSHLPESLVEISAAYFMEGDNGATIDEKPSWLNTKKFRKGQKFYHDYSFANTYNELLALFAVFSFDIGLDVLIFTGASDTPYKAFKRYVSTHFRFDNWYTSDPWTRGTPAYNDMKYTRQKHNIVQKNISSVSMDSYENRLKLNPMWTVSAGDTHADFQSTCSAVNPAQCPYTVLNQFPNQSLQHISQAAMSIIQFGFCGLIVYKPQLFGIHNATDEELDAFCHLWRGLGFLLGIDDDYNFCRGSLEDVRNRTRDVLEYWVKPNLRDIRPEWEHMLRCVSESIQYYYFPLTTFECCLLHLAEIVDVPMPRFSASLSYDIKLKHYLCRFYFQYGSKIPGSQRLMNYALKQAMEKTKKFDEKKHKQLQIKSKRALDFSSWKLKSIEKSEQFNTVQSLAIKLTAIMVTVVGVAMLYTRNVIY